MAALTTHQRANVPAQKDVADARKTALFEERPKWQAAGQTKAVSLARAGQSINRIKVLRPPSDIVQTKSLAIGVRGDKYERQADKVARQTTDLVDADHCVSQVMRGRFGNDLDGVKLHTDSKADKISRSLNARAFTHGQDIFFKRGEYNPRSSSGQHLLAHEITHTLQQTNRQVAGLHTVPDDLVQRVKLSKESTEGDNIKLGEFSDVNEIVDKFYSYVEGNAVEKNQLQEAYLADVKDTATWNSPGLRKSVEKQLTNVMFEDSKIKIPTGEYLTSDNSQFTLHLSNGKSVVIVVNDDNHFYRAVALLKAIQNDLHGRGSRVQLKGNPEEVTEKYFVTYFGIEKTYQRYITNIAQTCSDYSEDGNALSAIRAFLSASLQGTRKSGDDDSIVLPISLNNFANDPSSKTTQKVNEILVSMSQAERVDSEVLGEEDIKNGKDLDTDTDTPPTPDTDDKASSESQNAFKKEAVDLINKNWWLFKDDLKEAFIEELRQNSKFGMQEVMDDPWKWAEAELTDRINKSNEGDTKVLAEILKSQSKDEDTSENIEQLEPKAVEESESSNEPTSPSSMLEKLLEKFDKSEDLEETKEADETEDGADRKEALIREFLPDYLEIEFDENKQLQDIVKQYLIEIAQKSMYKKSANKKSLLNIVSSQRELIILRFAYDVDKTGSLAKILQKVMSAQSSVDRVQAKMEKIKKELGGGILSRSLSYVIPK